MPQLITEPTRIPVPGGKIITEHVGLVNSAGNATPEFDEVTLVLKGQVIVAHGGGRTSVNAGQSVITAAGERVRYSCSADGAEYVAVCLPAFSPEAAHREDG